LKDFTAQTFTDELIKYYGEKYGNEDEEEDDETTSEEKNEI